jgi:hypothetical protein
MNGMNDSTLASIGDTVSFNYKGGRFVKGEVTFVNKTGIALILHTDYIGKNVDWYKGEVKDFNLKECKNFTVIKSKS